MKKYYIAILLAGVLIIGDAQISKKEEVNIPILDKEKIDSEFVCLKEKSMAKQDSIFKPIEKDLKKIEKATYKNKKKVVEFAIL